MVLIILPEAVFSHYHTQAYAKSVQIIDNDGQTETYKKTYAFMFESNFIMGSYTWLCYMYFYVFLQLSLLILAIYVSKFIFDRIHTCMYLNSCI